MEINNQVYIKTKCFLINFEIGPFVTPFFHATQNMHEVLLNWLNIFVTQKDLPKLEACCIRTKK